jgi:hypothetical protein
MTCCATITRVAIVLACMASLSGSALAQPRSVPSGHPDYAVTTLTATDANTANGQRSSSRTLKMVGGQRYAKLEADTTGTKIQSEPTWSGVNFNNASSFDGQEHALWNGSDDATAIATATCGSASVDIQIFSTNTETFTIDWKASGAKDVETQLNSYITQYKKQPTWQFSGGVEISKEPVDYYADGEKIGHRVKASGNISFGFAAIEAPFLPISVYAGVQFTPSASIDKLTGTFKLTFHYDESLQDPWSEPVAGDFSASAGVNLGFKLSAGLDKVAEAYVKADIGTSLNVGGTFAADGRRILLKSAYARAGILKGQAEFGVRLLDNIEYEIYVKAGTWPNEDSTSLEWESQNESEIYTIPEPL